MNNRTAFTLIELLIVVAIIAILAAIAVPNFLEAQIRAKVGRTMSDMRTLATSVEAYRIDYDAYPMYGRVMADGMVEVPAAGAGLNGLNEFAMSNLTTPVAYISSFLFDPFADAWLEPSPEMQYYNYINLVEHIKMPGAPPLFVAQGFVDLWGEWRMSACGPDGDRGYDTKTGIIYDPSNGTVSNGDIVRSQRSSTNVVPSL